MKAKRKQQLKHIVDVLLTLILLCLMAYQVTGEALHEWFGVAMMALLILHHILNRRWYKTLFKGKYNAYRVVTVIVNTLLLATIALTAVCGMSMSGHAVPFLYGMLPISFVRRFHLAMSFWSFILMGLHLGLHIPAMTAGWKLSGKAKPTLTLIFAVIAGLGLWLFLRNGIPEYIFFRTPFAFFDYDKAAVLVFFENLAILIFFAFIGGQTAAFAWHEKNAAKRKSRKLRAAGFALAAVLFGVILTLLAGGDSQTPSWDVPAEPGSTQQEPSDRIQAWQ